MNTPPNDQQVDIRELLASLPEPEWVRKMREHYRATGQYRAEDLRRLLGDPNQSVQTGPSATVPSNFCAR